MIDEARFQSFVRVYKHVKEILGEKSNKTIKYSMVLKKVDHLSVDQMIALYDKRKKTQGVFLELVVYAENNVTNQCSNIFSDVFMSDDGLIVLNQALSCIRSDVLLNKAGILDD